MSFLKVSKFKIKSDGFFFFFHFGNTQNNFSKFLYLIMLLGQTLFFSNKFNKTCQFITKNGN